MCVVCAWRGRDGGEGCIRPTSSSLPSKIKCDDAPENSLDEYKAL